MTMMMTMMMMRQATYIIRFLHFLKLLLCLGGRIFVGMQLLGHFFVRLPYVQRGAGSSYLKSRIIIRLAILVIVTLKYKTNKIVQLNFVYFITHCETVISTIISNITSLMAVPRQMTNRHVIAAVNLFEVVRNW